MPLLTENDLATTGMRVLVYGPAGVGKTLFCGSVLGFPELGIPEVPEMQPMLYCDCEGGTMTIRERLRGNLGKKVDVLPIHSNEDIGLMVEFLWGKRAGKYKTIVLDSLTEFYTVVMREHLRGQGRDTSAIRLQDYGSATSYVTQFLANVKERSTLHFLCTAGDDVEKDEISGSLRIGPDVTGQLARRAPRYFDIVGYLDVEIRARADGVVRSTKRTMRLQPFGNVRAKDRIPNSPFGAVLVNPTVRLFYDALFGDMDQVRQQLAAAEEDEGSVEEETTQSNAVTTEE